jgi:hypothetical protein
MAELEAVETITFVYRRTDSTHETTPLSPSYTQPSIGNFERDADRAVIDPHWTA